MFNRKNTWIMAHRGMPHSMPENTISSFKEALKYEPDFIELDIHRCKTGELVVIHDHDVSRTTDGHGIVEDLSFKEIRKLNAGTKEKKEKIPTLSEVIKLINGKCKLNIEIKSKFCDDELIKDLLKIIHKNKILKKVFITSFNHKSLAKIKDLDPNIKTGALFIEKKNLKTYLRRLYFTNTFLKKAMLIDADSINIPYQFVTKRILSKAHKSGIKIMAWATLENHKENKYIEKMLKLGVDAIITNRADKFQ